MKPKLTSFKLPLIGILLLMFCALNSNAQWNISGANAANIGTISAVGIGNFNGTATPLAARLHLSNFLCNLPNGPLSGWLFRTDGNQNIMNKWQLYTGTGASSSSVLLERFRLSVPAFTSNVFLNSVQQSGNMQFQTTSITRIFINNNLGVTRGFVGIGNNVLTPGNTLEIKSAPGFSPQPAGLRFTNLTSSSTAGSNPGPGVLAVNAQGDVIYVNSSSSGATLCGGIPVNNVVKFTGGTTLCQTNITDLPGNRVGINFINPTNALDVDRGYINVVDPFKGYKIDDSVVLWHQGVVQNIYCGVGAGASITPGAFRDAFFGYHAGFSLTGPQNTTIIGCEAGEFDLGGDEDVFIGWRAGRNCNGLHNVMIGNTAGQNSTNGYQETFVGIGSGNGDISGQNNVCLGGGAGVATASSLSFASAIGAGSQVMRSHEMILGIDTTRVGIGLSGNTSGVNNMLEINSPLASDVTPNPYVNLGGGTGITGESGLRFTDLTSSSTPGNARAGVLSVDAFGNVILVKDSVAGGGSTFGNLCGSPQVLLPGTWEIPMNNFNYMFNENSSGGVNEVGIGHAYGTCANAIGKFEVWSNNTNSIAGEFLNNANLTVNTIGVRGTASSTTFDAIGVRGNATGAGANNNAVGVGGSSTGNTAANNYGVVGVAANATNLSIAGNFNANNSSSPTIYGVKATIVNGTNTSSTNWGIADSVSSNSTSNIGLDCQVLNGTSLNLGGNFDVVGTSSSQNLGVSTTVNGVGSFYNAGVSSTTFGSGSSTNYAGNFTVGDALSNNYAVAANCFNSTAAFNYGVYSTCASAGISTFSYGVYSQCLPVSTAGTGPNWAGFFDGDVFTTSSAYYVSDKTLKKDVNTIKNSLDIINKLNPVNYSFDLASHKDIGLTDKKQWGFLSQEVKEILPELTSPVVYPATYDSKGKETRKNQEYVGLNYNGFIAILTKGIQEQQTQIEDQKKMLADQQRQIDELKNLVIGSNGSTINGNRTIAQQTIELSDKDAIVLNQNVPNPFAEQTIITYNVPENTNSAQLIFYNEIGKMIKSVDIKEKGKGQLNVFANDLSSGVYSYALIVDGKIADTKKMQKTK